MNKSLPEWLSYLEKLHPNEIELGLGRITQVGKKLDLCKFGATVITVGGTNGKGTTCAFLEEILCEAGYKVGVYSSPHILRYTERLRVNKKELTEQHHCEAFSKIEAIRADISLSYFEYVTLGCLQLLKEAQCDFILLEVGLGGRLDATNMVESDVSVTTTIAIDHTDWLGDDREAIGFEKAGIYRANKPVICGETEPPLSLQNHAKSINAEIRYAGKDFTVTINDSSWSWQGKETFNDLPLTSMPLQNCATALAVIEVLGLKLDPVLIRKTIGNAKLSGRFEKIEMNIENSVYIDVAHNPQSGAYLASQLKTLRNNSSIPIRIISIVGMLQDKDSIGTFSELNSVIDQYNFVELDCYRAAPLELLHESYNKSRKNNQVDVICYQNVKQAYKNIIKQISPSDIIVIFGSFYTVSDFLMYSQGKYSEPAV